MSLNYLDKRTTAAVVLALLGAGVLSWLSPSIVTTSDIAVTELYTDLASHAQLLVGPYSRFGWHHPGPLYFYLLAPLYVLSGRSGAALYIAAVVFNAAAVGVVLKILIAERRYLAALTIACGCLALAVRVTDYFSSPWTANIVAFPMLALLAACAAVAAGRTSLLPVAAFTASFLVQTDLALVPAVAAVTLLTLWAVAWTSARTGQAPLRDLAIAAILSAIVWTPAILEGVSRDGGNVAALWRFFVAGEGRAHTLGEALGAWSYGLLGVVRPQLAIPWGKPLNLSTITWETPAALALVAVVAASVILAVRRKYTFDAWIGTMLLTGAAATLWALTRARGDLLDHEVFWLAPMGAMAAGFAIASISASALPQLTGTAVDRLARLAASAILIVLGVIGVVEAERTIGLAQRLAERHDVRDAIAAVEAHLNRRQSRAVVIDVGDLWPLGTSLVLRIHQHHWRVAVTPASVFMFTDAYAPSGREDTWLTVQRGRTVPTGAEPIFDSRNIAVVSVPSAPAR
jgi:hypothetical protein